MADPDELETDIIDAIRTAPINGLSDGTLREILNRKGHDLSHAEVRQICSGLARADRLEVIARKGSHERYGLVQKLSEGQ